MRTHGHRILAFALSTLAFHFSITPIAKAAWLSGAPLTTARYGHTATLLGDGKLLVAGGGSEFGFFSSAELYDPTNGTWKAVGSMVGNRELHTSTLLPNRKVLIAGGLSTQYNYNYPSSGAELYDDASGTWTETGPMATARYSHTATLLPNGKVLAAGGGDTFGFLSSAELFDPVTGQWTPLDRMTVPRSQHTATSLANGKVLITGGVNLSSSEVYDPTTGKWTATGSMRNLRRLFTATLMANGRVLVAGGLGSGTVALSSAELFDPAAGTWTPANSMATARYSHTAILLPDGKVLVAGGCGSDWLARAELFDPVTGTWAEIAAMTTPRSGHTATLLRDGKVLVAGGLNQIGDLIEAVSSTESYGNALATINRQNDGRVRIQFSATPGSVTLIQASTNILDWETIGRATEGPLGTFSFDDANAAKLPGRFYRVLGP